MCPLWKSPRWMTVSMVFSMSGMSSLSGLVMSSVLTTAGVEFVVRFSWLLRRLTISPLEVVAIAHG